MIDIQNLSKYYVKGQYKITALNNLSLNIKKGEFISIVGRSGSGKSTLLNLLGGLDTADTGSIYFNSKNLLNMSRTELSLHRKKSVGMIFQSFNLISSKTAMDNVILALIFGGVARNKRTEKAKSILKIVGLQDRIDHKPAELSGGEAQRVAIARALANQPDMLLADEPTGNLDSQTAQTILSLLLKLNKERHVTVLMVTHDQEMANKVSDRVFVLSDGQVVNCYERGNQ